MQSREVLVAGWPGEGPRLGETAWRRISIDAVQADVEDCRHGAVLVLGDAALSQCVPSVVARTAHPPRCFVLGVPRSTNVETLARWWNEGAARLVSERCLDWLVADLVRTPVLAEVPLEAWVPRLPPPGTTAERIVRIIPTLRPPKVELLAQEIGLERHAIAKECRRHFGARPLEVCWSYTRAVIREERSRGSCVARIAEALGFDDPGTIWRHYKACDEELPPRAVSSGTGNSRSNSPLTLPKRPIPRRRGD